MDNNKRCEDCVGCLRPNSCGKCQACNQGGHSTCCFRRCYQFLYKPATLTQMERGAHQAAQKYPLEFKGLYEQLYKDFEQQRIDLGNSASKSSESDSSICEIMKDEADYDDEGHTRDSERTTGEVSTGDDSVEDDKSDGIGSSHAAKLSTRCGNCAGCRRTISCGECPECVVKLARGSCQQRLPCCFRRCLQYSYRTSDLKRLHSAALQTTRANPDKFQEVYRMIFPDFLYQTRVASKNIQSDQHKKICLSLEKNSPRRIFENKVVRRRYCAMNGRCGKCFGCQRPITCGACRECIRLTDKPCAFRRCLKRAYNAKYLQKWYQSALEAVQKRPTKHLKALFHAVYGDIDRSVMEGSTNNELVTGKRRPAPTRSDVLSREDDNEVPPKLRSQTKIVDEDKSPRKEKGHPLSSDRKKSRVGAVKKETNPTSDRCGTCYGCQRPISCGKCRVCFHKHNSKVCAFRRCRNRRYSPKYFKELHTSALEAVQNYPTQHVKKMYKAVYGDVDPSVMDGGPKTINTASTCKPASASMDTGGLTDGSDEDISLVVSEDDAMIDMGSDIAETFDQDNDIDIDTQVASWQRFKGIRVEGRRALCEGADWNYGEIIHKSKLPGTSLPRYSIRFDDGELREKVPPYDFRFLTADDIGDITTAGSKSHGCKALVGKPFLQEWRRFDDTMGRLFGTIRKVENGKCTVTPSEKSDTLLEYGIGKVKCLPSLEVEAWEARGGIFAFTSVKQPDAVQFVVPKMARGRDDNGYPTAKFTILGFDVELFIKPDGEKGQGLWAKVSSQTEGDETDLVLPAGMAIDLGVYGPMEHGDIKAFPVQIAKRFIHKNNCSCWLIEGEKGGDGDIRFDPTCDVTGELRARARSNLLVYVNEVEGNDEENLWFGYDPEGACHIYLGRSQPDSRPLKLPGRGVHFRLLIKYGHEYELERVRKNYPRVSGIELQHYVERIVEEDSELIRDIGEFSLKQIKEVSSFLQSLVAAWKASKDEVDLIKVGHTLMVCIVLLQRAKSPTSPHGQLDTLDACTLATMVQQDLRRVLKACIDLFPNQVYVKMSLTTHEIFLDEIYPKIFPESNPHELKASDMVAHHLLSL